MVNVNAATDAESVNITLPDQERLEAWGIPVEVATAAGVRSVAVAADLPEELAWAGKQAPGLLFLHHPAGGGDPIPQFRPDAPADPTAKYLQPKGSGSIISLHPWMRDRLGSANRLLIVEGTKQYLAAIAVVPDDMVAVGIQGCTGWMSDGVALPALTALLTGGADHA